MLGLEIVPGLLDVSTSFCLIPKENIIRLHLSSQKPLQIRWINLVRSHNKLLSVSFDFPAWIYYLRLWYNNMRSNYQIPMQLWRDDSSPKANFSHPSPCAPHPPSSILIVPYPPSKELFPQTQSQESTNIYYSVSTWQIVMEAAEQQLTCIRPLSYILSIEESAEVDEKQNQTKSQESTKDGIQKWHFRVLQFFSISFWIFAKCQKY